nr:hypothetical protein [Bacilli bacterium]
MNISRKELSSYMETIKSTKLTVRKFNICCGFVLPAIENLGPICKAKYYANILIHKGVIGGTDKDIDEYKNNMDRIANIISNYYITKYTKQYNNGEFNDTIFIINQLLMLNEISFEEYINIFGFIDIIKDVETFNYLRYAKALYKANVIYKNDDEKETYENTQAILKNDIETKKKIKTT